MRSSGLSSDPFSRNKDGQLFMSDLFLKHCALKQRCEAKTMDHPSEECASIVDF